MSMSIKRALIRFLICAIFGMMLEVLASPKDFGWCRSRGFCKSLSYQLIYLLDEEVLKKLPVAAGIYIFARRWGNTY